MHSTKKNQELSYITFLQSYAVTLVIIGHCLPRANVDDIYPIWADFIFKFVYSFHMPLFFVLGGFLLAYSFYRKSKTLTNFKNFVLNKTKRLIIPYICIGTLAYLLKVFIFNKFAYRPTQPTLLFYLKSMVIPWDNPNIYLWFLPTMFLVLFIGYLLLKKYNYKDNFLIFLILSFFVSLISKYIKLFYNIFNICGVLYYVFFFIGGIVLFKKREIIFEILKNPKFILLTSTIFILFFNLKSDCHQIINYLISYVLAICGILLSFSLAIFCSKNEKKFLFGFIDGKYYQLYLLSWFFQAGTRIFYQIHLVNYPTVCCLMFISSIIFPLIITLIITKYIPKLKIFIGL